MDLAGVLERGPQKIATLLDSNDIYMTFSEFQNFRNHPQISKKHDVLWFLPPGAFLGDVVEATDGTTTSGRSDDSAHPWSECIGIRRKQQSMSLSTFFYRVSGPKKSKNIAER